MAKKTKKAKIYETLKAMGIENKKVVSMGELDKICKATGCTLHEVMHYLRFER
jgi:DNA-binding Xre family transcriptional regulator